jgi:hypothetical protein
VRGSKDRTLLSLDAGLTHVESFLRGPIDFGALNLMDSSVADGSGEPTGTSLGSSAIFPPQKSVSEQRIEG